MTIRPSDVIRVAEGEIGYHEKASNKNLDDKTANSGNKNYTKYARDLYKAGYYNGNKQSCEWCDQATDWFFFVACGKDKKKAEYIQCQTGDLGAGTLYSMNYYKAQNRFDKNPKVGDQIFFLYSGNTGFDHTGLVVGVTSTQITTIEGNSDNQVRKRTYARNYAAILGYGHPKYDAYDEEKQEEKTVTITLKELKRGSTGDQVKTVQRILRSRGWKDQNGDKLKIDGSFGGKTEAALKKFQKKFGLTVDGVVGKKTWDKILGVT